MVLCATVQLLPGGTTTLPVTLPVMAPVQVRLAACAVIARPVMAVSAKTRVRAHRFMADSPHCPRLSLTMLRVPPQSCQSVSANRPIGGWALDTRSHNARVDEETR